MRLTIMSVCLPLNLVLLQKTYITDWDQNCSNYFSTNVKYKHTQENQMWFVHMAQLQDAWFPQATGWHDGQLVQNLSGSIHLTALPHPNKNQYKNIYCFGWEELNWKLMESSTAGTKVMQYMYNYC